MHELIQQSWHLLKVIIVFSEVKRANHLTFCQSTFRVFGKLMYGRSCILVFLCSFNSFLITSYTLANQINFHRCSRCSWDLDEAPAWVPCPAARGRTGGPTSAYQCFKYRRDSRFGHKDYRSRDSHLDFVLQLFTTRANYSYFYWFLFSRKLIMFYFIFWRPSGHRSSSPCLPAHVRYSSNK